MTTRSLIPAAILSAIAISSYLLWLADYRRDEAKRNEAPAEAQGAEKQTGTGKQLSTSQQAALQSTFQSIMGEMRKMGAKDVGPVGETLAAAVTRGSEFEIVRAFHQAIYDRYANMPDVSQALKSFLSHANPLVRFEAAKGLYVIGETTGYETLLALVRAPNPLGVGEADLRARAAEVLGTFREKRASNDLLSLYGKTDGLLANAYCPLGISPDAVRTKRYYPGEDAIRVYTLCRFTHFIPDIRNTFEQNKGSLVGIAAAWSLVELAGEEQHIDHLVSVAEPAIVGAYKATWSPMDEKAMAVYYLGSIRHPQAREALERALDSTNGQVVGYALVNLIFNQGGSQKANDLLVKALKLQTRTVEHELLFQVAAKSNDPAVLAAGRDFDLKTGEGAWRLYATTRKNWPIYNWIDQYVPKLNE
jgi:hypothetical protein